jgi:hypothetical protein
MTDLSFEQLRDLSGGRLGITDAPCPVCGPERHSAVNQRRKVFRVWYDTASFLTYRCARCEVEGYAYDGSAVGQRPDPTAIERAKAKAKERQRIEAADSLRKSGWLWSRRQSIAGSIAETYLRDCRGYRGPLPETLGFLPARGEHGPAMIAAFGMAHEIAPGEIVIDNAAARGVHLTKLKPDGSGKAGVEEEKITVGKTSVGFPIVLAPVNDGLGLVVTEGIEDALSIHEATGLGAWAAGTANRMPVLAPVVPDYVECISIFGDPDLRGRENAQKLATALQRRDRDVRLIIPSHEGIAA